MDTLIKLTVGLKDLLRLWNLGGDSTKREKKFICTNIKVAGNSF